MNTCKSCGSFFPRKQVIEGIPRNFQRRQHCLQCSPFGKHNTKNLSKNRARPTTFKCEICDKSYSDMKRRKLCGSCRTKIRRFRNKQAAVELLGGVCEGCGWEGKDLAGFSFHHPDPNKEFAIGSAANKSWDVVKAEVLKCKLLCVRCHNIHHSDYANPKLIAHAKLYKGRLLG